MERDSLFLGDEVTEHPQVVGGHFQVSFSELDLRISFSADDSGLGRTRLNRASRSASEGGSEAESGEERVRKGDGGRRETRDRRRIWRGRSGVI